MESSTRSAPRVRMHGNYTDCLVDRRIRRGLMGLLDFHRSLSNQVEHFCTSGLRLNMDSTGIRAALQFLYNKLTSKVSWTRCWSCPRWVIRLDPYPVRSYAPMSILEFANFQRPSESEKSPFSCISSSESDQQAMKEAEKNTNVVIVSDWSKFTSTEYFEAEQKSNLDI